MVHRATWIRSEKNRKTKLFAQAQVSVIRLSDISRNLRLRRRRGREYGNRDKREFYYHLHYHWEMVTHKTLQYTFLLLRKNVKIRLRVSVQNLLIISGFVLWVLTKYWQLNQWKETLQRRIWDIPGGAFNTDWMIISGVLLERYKPDRSVSEGKT